MSLVDPKPEYLAELDALFAAIADDADRESWHGFEIPLLCAAGQYPQAAALALSLSATDQHSASNRVHYLAYVALAMNADLHPR